MGCNRHSQHYKETTVKFNDLDIKEMVNLQLERSRMNDVSRYSYTKGISRLIKPWLHKKITPNTLEHIKQELIGQGADDITMYYFHFLESAISGTLSKPAEDLAVSCDCCGGKATLKSSALIYKGVHRGNIYLCENYNVTCDAYVGVHNGDNLPLGTLADGETRSARAQAHTVIDPLWKTQGFNRRDLYKIMSDFLGLKLEDCHIGKFNASQCKQACDFAEFISA